MDGFAIVVLGAVAAVVLGLWIVGRANQNQGLDSIGVRSGRQITEDREALEAQDLAQLLEAHNARRRRRGEPEVTVSDLEARVIEDAGEQRRARERYLEDRELDQLLEVTNARRRARGLPERSRDDVRREFGPGAG